MANKILESLTIGGTTFDMHSAETFGTKKSITIPTANTRVNGASITLDSPGIYSVSTQVWYAAASTTGTTFHSTVLNSSVWGDLRVLSGYDASNQSVIHTITTIIKKTDSANNTITVQGLSSRPITSTFNTALAIVKLIDLGEGGVIRRLLNALKPLAFSVERGCA